MKTSTFTEEQILQILRKADMGDQTTGAICRMHAISENTFCIHTAQCDSREPSLGCLTQRQCQGTLTMKTIGIMSSSHP